MNTKDKRFPLPLSSIVDKGKGIGASHAPRTATPQTAMQNQSASRGLSPKPLTTGIATIFGAASMPGPANKPAGKTYAEARQSQSSPPVHGGPRPLVSDAVRRAMVGRVAQQGVKDSLVLAALEAVPRHLFIESGLASQAYIDASLPIGHHQTISQPYIVARMIEIMRNGGTLNRVLEIGTGCGYQAAVLSLVAKDVYSIERIKALHELAKTNLRPMRIANIRLHYGDGMLGLPQVAPFDGIILAAAGMEVPQALLDQLSIGGRLIAPVGGKNQVLQLIQRVAKNEWSSSVLEQCHFVPLHKGVI
ncbi:protein-L-isoaspartate(D-aspartate) O-methyltransferase [Undibacterium sp.]|jgi:protein-L-isoaspartate(D-aspartate) O-methyltransferase|uniref:protein-L-isoaspartate(D-aspartate) O-methyltransferase n=1 Tax=Undibacterium sp. TaxID=1914977 RepID=UPI002B7D1DF8|nr:protein-L-isoaspartate(D-aspartate) O-methyltransferase [Undibacterium sp.]HTD02361.1 protein-L-isoaspartate(D-aspartate) O-methyltransferase [Undibacterium sp.]